MRSTAADAVAQLHTPDSEAILHEALVREQDADVQGSLQAALRHLEELH